MSTPNTTPLTYNAYVTQLATLAVENVSTISGVVTPVSAPFAALIPQALNYAELRIQRDLDLLQLLVSNTYQLPSGTNLLSISVNDFVTLQTFTSPSGPIHPVSKEFLQNVYGSNAITGPPLYFAIAGGDLASTGNVSTNVLFGPYADATYQITAYGTVRQQTLNQFGTTNNAGSSTTFISTNLPDMLLMASMIYVSGYQRNFSAAGNDPEMPGSYEAQYQNLLKGAITEEGRKKFNASAWSSMSVPAAATPNR
jgi:hypothetical protein